LVVFFCPYLTSLKPAKIVDSLAENSSKKPLPTWQNTIFRLPNFAANQLVAIMEVITIDSQAYKELVSKINAIAKFVIDHQEDETTNPDEMWVDSYEVCTFLKISERTLQRLRSNRLISYSIISGKSYYTIAEIKRMLNEKKIRSTEECMNDLINNHKLHAQQRRTIKTDE
jgi:hypothetical protein